MVCGLLSSSRRPAFDPASSLGEMSDGASDDAFFSLEAMPDFRFFECAGADFGAKLHFMRGNLVPFNRHSDHMSGAWFACPDSTASAYGGGSKQPHQFSSRDIVVVVRGGGCSFARKVLEVQLLGAGAVIIADLSGASSTDNFRMGSSDLDDFAGDIAIPSVFVSGSVASSIMSALKAHDIPPPPWNSSWQRPSRP